MIKVSKFAIVLLMAVFVASCGAKKGINTNEGDSVSKNKPSDKIKLGDKSVVNYKSMGNGVASINLKLFENDTFKLDFKSIPQPEDGGDSIKISEKGRYTSEGNWKTLKFYNPKFDVPSLFDTQYGDASQFEIVDSQTVKINSASKTINIWGVACQKQ